MKIVCFHADQCTYESVIPNSSALVFILNDQNVKPVAGVSLLSKKLLLRRSASNIRSIRVMVPPGNSVHGENMRPLSAGWFCNVLFSSKKHVNDGDVTNRISFLSLLCPFLNKKNNVLVSWFNDRQVAPLFPLFSDGRRDGRTSYWRSSCSKTTSRVGVTLFPPKSLSPRRAAEPPLDSPAAVAPPVGGGFEQEKGGRFYLMRVGLWCLAVFFCFVFFFPLILRRVCVFGQEPWDCCLTILYIKKCTHWQHSTGRWRRHQVQLHHFAFALYLISFFSERIEAAGWAGQVGGRVFGGVANFAAHQDQSWILNDAKCFMCSSTTSDLSGVSSPPPSLCAFSCLYLFKAEIYGLYQAWEGEANVAVDWNRKLFILQQYTCFTLEICFCLFVSVCLIFFKQIKSFSIPKRLSASCAWRCRSRAEGPRAFASQYSVEDDKREKSRPWNVKQSNVWFLIAALEGISVTQPFK